MIEEQVCDLCKETKRFQTFIEIKLINVPYSKSKEIEKVAVCHDCRSKPINEIYKIMMEKMMRRL